MIIPSIHFAWKYVRWPRKDFFYGIRIGRWFFGAMRDTDNYKVRKSW